MIWDSDGKARAVEGFDVQGPVREERYSASALALKLMLVRSQAGVGTDCFWSATHQLPRPIHCHRLLNIQGYDRRTRAWSWRLLPTPGRSTSTAIPRGDSTLAIPTPDSSRSWGLWIAPAARMTSRLARTVHFVPLRPPSTYHPVNTDCYEDGRPTSTPTARRAPRRALVLVPVDPSLKRMRPTCALVTTW